MNYSTMLIYKRYNQEDLDRQYNNRLNAPDHEYHLQQWELFNREAERKYSVHKNIPYGGLERETLDIFPSEKPGSGTLVFIHGGYWYKSGPSDAYLVVEAFRAYGITTVLIGYPLMPDFPMDQLVLSCRRAIGWVHANIARYNGDAGRVFVAGHSAGGHLASMMMAANRPQPDQKPGNKIIQGICAISGLYNLLPIQLCYVNETLKMDTAMALRNSPVQLLPETACPLLLAVGGEETAEYKEQSRELFNTWSAKNADVRLLEIPGTNHFSILTSILDRSSILHSGLCGLMGINAQG